MKPLTQEWVEKAEGDWHAARQLYRARKPPNYDAARFHAQQCAEKYLKARLKEADISFAKTHNLIALLAQVLDCEPTWALLQPALNALNIYAIDFRDPGESAEKEDAKNAIKDCAAVRRLARQAFALPD